MWLQICVWVATCGVSWGNYDEYMTCGSGSERYGRHYNHHYHEHPDLPCDITKDSWCESAGHQYPWGAVRKFVYENQGLMKRMYGNQRHYNVLKSELLNELYDDMFDEMPKRQHQYPRPQVPTARSARYQKPSSANTFRTNSGKQGSPGQKTSRDSKQRSSHESATKQRADHESGLNSRTSQESRSNTGTSQESRSSSRTSQESGSRSRTSQETGSRSRTSQESGSSSRTSQESEANTRTDSRAMKVSIVPEYSGVRRHHEQSRVKIQSKAPKIRRKTAGTRGRPTTTTSTMSTTHQTTSTTNTGTITTTSEIPLATTTEDVTTTESQWYDVDEYTEESQIPEYTPFVESDTQPPLHPYPEDQDEGWTTLSDPSYAPSASSYSTPYSSYDTESSYVSVTETSTSAYPTTHSDILDDLMDDEGYISTPLDQDDLTTLTLTADFDEDPELDLSPVDGTTTVGADLNDGADIWPEDDEETTVDDADYDMDEGGMIVESEKLKVEMREHVDDGGLEVDIGGGHVEMRESVDGVRVDDLRVEGNVQEEAKMEAPSESVHIQRPVRGMNACPVKEEFVAPYWANNTRGQTLALLNLYPFEQYVQWERCKFEHRQMYCRAGCRCEQQYRLHKLLAFDPTNECRGIFSDWFRFPSCCVCKCYDLPADIFTPSSRRPRINGDDEDDYEYLEEEEEEETEDEFDDHYPPPPPRPPYVNIPPQRRPRLPPRPYSHISPPSFTLRPPSPLPSDTPNIQPQDQKLSGTQARVNSRSHKFSSAQPRPNPQTQNAQSRSDTRSHTYARGQERVAASRTQRFHHQGAGTPNRLTQNESTQRPEMSTLGTLDVATPHYYFNLTNYARVLLAKGQASPGLTRIPRSTEE